jgi:uncharacterized protein (DUF2147 family)
MKEPVLGCLVVLSVVPAFAADGNVTGNWHVVGNIAGTISDSVCTLTEDGTKLTGACKGEDSTNDVTGTVTDKEISWSLKSNYNGTDLTITYAGTPGDGKTFSGTVDVQPMNIQGTFKADKE